MNVVSVGSDGHSDVEHLGFRKRRAPSARTRALVLDSNIRHCYDLVDPRKTRLLRFVVLILAIHAATSFEAAADGSHSGNDVPHSDPDQPEPGELIITKPAAFRYALAEFNETGMLIEFFLPWCGHSRRLRPELSQARDTPTHVPHQTTVIRIVPSLHIPQYRSLALGPRPCCCARAPRRWPPVPRPHPQNAGASAR